MTRFTSIIVLLIGLTAGVLYGADFWQKKKFMEWSDKEVQRMLTNSPWAHAYEIANPASLPSSGSGVGGRGGRRGGGGGGGGGFGADSSSGSMDADTGGASGRGEVGGGQGMRPAAVFHFRILSALPMKHAIAKLRYGKETLTSPDAARFLARQETSYIVGISGMPPAILKGADVASLRNQIQLKIKGKPAAYAREVQFEKDGPLLNVYIFFSRTDNPIAIEDGEFQVVVKLPNTEMKRTFKLKDMTYEGKLEI